nr:MAG TPA: hypothetical protein [Caudoviricetes sp.]
MRIKQSTLHGDDKVRFWHGADRRLCLILYCKLASLSLS